MLQKSLKYSMNGQDFATESIKTTPVKSTKCLPLALLRTEAHFFRLYSESIADFIHLWCIGKKREGGGGAMPRAQFE